MSRITIHIDGLPEGATASIAPQQQAVVQQAPQGFVQGRPKGDANWRCPVHGGAKFVPAGTSKKSGKAYSAFYGCTEMGCREAIDA